MGWIKTALFSREIEPDKRFLQRGILDYQAINTGLIAYRPLEERIMAYVNTGNYAKALELFEQTIREGGRQGSAVIRGLFRLRTQQGLDKLGPIATSPQNATANKIALTLFRENIAAQPLEDLQTFRFYLQTLKQNISYTPPSQVRGSLLLFNKLLSYLGNSN